MVTSTTSGTHKSNSLHYKGLAIDLRTRDLTYKESLDFYLFLKRNLGKDYDVLLYKTHIHIEYDPKS